MPSQDDSRPLYITGGQGGHGGHGHPHGTGGPGGTGLGPNVTIIDHQYIVQNLHPGPASQQAFQPSNIQASQTINHCPPPSRIFQGRRDILEKMHCFFTSDVGIQHIYVLYGLGGAGKTQIALKFINQSSSQLSDTFFIDASTIATIDTGLKNIAVVKHSGNSPQDGLLWLTSNSEGWLLFFDNADDPSINLNDFFPLCNHGNIIITTRNPGLRVYGSHSPVSDMEEEDAVALLLTSAAQAATTGTMLTAAEIVKALYYLPLAIVQAGSFISKSQDFDGYLTLYAKNQARLLSEMPAQTHDHYAQTVYTTWQMSFDRLTQPAAMFLQYCSFLHHNGISEQIFSYASEYAFPCGWPSKEDLWEPLEFLSYFLGPSGEWDSLQFSNMTNEVQAYSLISIDAEKKLFSIHPLVHAWSKTTGNPKKYLPNMGSILGMALSARSRYDIQLGSLEICPHVELALQMDAEVALVFKEQYGWILWEAGKYKQYENLLEGVLEKQKQVLGDSHPDTLLTMGSLASTYSGLGEHQKAKELNLTVLEKQKQVLGDNHPSTLLTMGNLARTYSDLGEHQRAKGLNITVLEKRKQVLGDNHPDTLLTMGNLAWTYSCLGEHQKAKELNLTVLEKRKQVLGDNHRDTLHTINNLARTYLDLGECQRGKELNLTVLEKQKQVLGDNHPDTLHTMNDLASTYSDLGEHQRAKELKATVLEKRKQVLGDNHPDTLHTMNNLARTYIYLGEYERAKELNLTVLEKRKQVLGDHHPDTLLTMGNLAITYSDLGEHQKAKELNLTVLEKQKQVLGNHHPDTLHTMYNLARTYSDLGEHQRAKELNLTVLEKRKQVLGDHHPDTLLIMGNLARTYSDLGEHQKAKELKATVLEKQEQVLGDNHPDTLLTMGNLAWTYSCLGEHQKAKELNLTVLEKQKQVLGDNHPSTLYTMNSLAWIYSTLEEHQKAKELKATLLEQQNQFPPPTYSPSLHVSPPLPLQPSHAPSSLPPLHKLGRGLKKQIASAAAEPTPAGETKATRKHVLRDNTRPHWH